MSRSRSAAPSLNRIFHVLTSERRRYVLYHLREQPGAVELDDLAVAVVARIENESPDAVTDEEIDRMVVRLRNAELPKLADVGIVEYDDRSGMVRFRDPGRLLGAFLLLAARVERPLATDQR